MTLAQQIVHLWRQGFDTYDIAQRTGATEPVVHREIIHERTQRRAAARTGGAA